MRQIGEGAVIGGVFLALAFAVYFAVVMVQHGLGMSGDPEPVVIIRSLMFETAGQGAWSCQVADFGSHALLLGCEPVGR